jgi:hypothetical protein
VVAGAVPGRARSRVAIFARCSWILIVFIVLPLSRLLDMYWRLRDWYYDNFLAKPHLHTERVAEIQRRVRAFREAGGPASCGGRTLCTARPQWLRTTLRQMHYQTSKNAIPMGTSCFARAGTRPVTQDGMQSCLTFCRWTKRR